MVIKSLLCLSKSWKTVFRFQNCYYSVNQYALPVGTWTYKVQPYWKFCAHLTNCKLKVMSYDPVKNIDGDELVVEKKSEHNNLGTVSFIYNQLLFKRCFSHLLL